MKDIEGRVELAVLKRMTEHTGPILRADAEAIVLECLPGCCRCPSDAKRACIDLLIESEALTEDAQGVRLTGYGLQVAMRHAHANIWSQTSATFH